MAEECVQVSSLRNKRVQTKKSYLQKLIRANEKFKKIQESGIVPKTDVDLMDSGFSNSDVIKDDEIERSFSNVTDNDPGIKNDANDDFDDDGGDDGKISPVDSGLSDGYTNFIRTNSRDLLLDKDTSAPGNSSNPVTNELTGEEIIAPDIIGESLRVLELVPSSPQQELRNALGNTYEINEHYFEESSTPVAELIDAGETDAKTTDPSAIEQPNEIFLENASAVNACIPNDIRCDPLIFRPKARRDSVVQTVDDLLLQPEDRILYSNVKENAEIGSVHNISEMVCVENGWLVSEATQTDVIKETRSTQTMLAHIDPDMARKLGFPMSIEEVVSVETQVDIENEDKYCQTDIQDGVQNNDPFWIPDKYSDYDIIQTPRSCIGDDEEQIKCDQFNENESSQSSLETSGHDDRLIYNLSVSLKEMKPIGELTDYENEASSPSFLETSGHDDRLISNLSVSLEEMKPIGECTDYENEAEYYTSGTQTCFSATSSIVSEFVDVDWADVYDSDNANDNTDDEAIQNDIDVEYADFNELDQELDKHLDTLYEMPNQSTSTEGNLSTPCISPSNLLHVKSEVLPFDESVDSCSPKTVEEDVIMDINVPARAAVSPRTLLRPIDQQSVESSPVTVEEDLVASNTAPQVESAMSNYLNENDEMVNISTNPVEEKNQIDKDLCHTSSPIPGIQVTLANNSNSPMSAPNSEKMEARQLISQATSPINFGNLSSIRSSQLHTNDAAVSQGTSPIGFGNLSPISHPDANKYETSSHVPGGYRQTNNFPVSQGSPSANMQNNMQYGYPRNEGNAPINMPQAWPYNNFGAAPPAGFIVQGEVPNVNQAVPHGFAPFPSNIPMLGFEGFVVPQYARLAADGSVVTQPFSPVQLVGPSSQTLPTPAIPPMVNMSHQHPNYGQQEYQPAHVMAPLGPNSDTIAFQQTLSQLQNAHRSPDRLNDVDEFPMRLELSNYSKSNVNPSVPEHISQVSVPYEYMVPQNSDNINIVPRLQINDNETDDINDHSRCSSRMSTATVDEGTQTVDMEGQATPFVIKVRDTATSPPCSEIGDVLEIRKYRVAVIEKILHDLTPSRAFTDVAEAKLNYQMGSTDKLLETIEDPWYTDIMLPIVRGEPKEVTEQVKQVTKEYLEECTRDAQESVNEIRRQHALDMEDHIEEEEKFLALRRTPEPRLRITIDAPVYPEDRQYTANSPRSQNLIREAIKNNYSKNSPRTNYRPQDFRKQYHNPDQPPSYQEPTFIPRSNSPQVNFHVSDSFIPRSCTGSPRPASQTRSRSPFAASLSPRSRERSKSPLLTFKTPSANMKHLLNLRRTLVTATIADQEKDSKN